MDIKSHTTDDGILNLSVNVGLPDSDVMVRLIVTSLDDTSGQANADWPEGYFDAVVGSMPDLERAPQGEYEQRLPLA